MACLGRLIGAGIGFATGGVIGALIGGAIGSMFDNISSGQKISGAENGNRRQNWQQNRQQMSQRDFYSSLLVLIAAVMKADGVVKKSELDYVKRYLLSSFGENNATQLLHALRDVLQKDIPLTQVCSEIRQNMPYASRLELLHLLYAIAQSDGSIDKSELDVIQTIANGLGISSADAESIKATFYDDLESAYTVLEISSSATDDEVRKAYKKMAVKYHPDKVSHLGEDVQRSATEKFKKINEAYEKIKKQRNIN